MKKLSSDESGKGKNRKTPPKLQKKDLVDRLEDGWKRYQNDVKKTLRDSGVDPDVELK